MSSLSTGNLSRTKSRGRFISCKAPGVNSLLIKVFKHFSNNQYPWSGEYHSAIKILLRDGRRHFCRDREVVYMLCYTCLVMIYQVQNTVHIQVEIYNHSSIHQFRMGLNYRGGWISFFDPTCTSNDFTCTCPLYPISN